MLVISARVRDLPTDDYSTMEERLNLLILDFIQWMHIYGHHTMTQTTKILHNNQISLWAVKHNIPKNLNIICELQQIINRPTHICANSLSRINLMFTNQPNLKLASRTSHAPLNQITFSKENLNVELIPPFLVANESITMSETKINPFIRGAPYLYPLKTSENLTVL